MFAGHRHLLPPKVGLIGTTLLDFRAYVKQLNQVKILNVEHTIVQDCVHTVDCFLIVLCRANDPHASDCLVLRRHLVHLLKVTYQAGQAALSALKQRFIIDSFLGDEQSGVVATLVHLFHFPATLNAYAYLALLALVAVKEPPFCL
jgi:hypothetical protein